VLTNADSRTIFREVIVIPNIDNNSLSAIVPSALGGGTIHTGGDSRCNGSITVSLECPSHVDIGRIRRKVRACIAVSTIGPSLTRIHNGTIRAVRDNDRDLVSFLVSSGNVIFLGTSLRIDQVESVKDGRRRGSNGPFTVSNKRPSKLIIITRLILVAVTRLVDVTGAFVNNGIHIIHGNCNLVVGLILSPTGVLRGAAIVIYQSIEGGRGSGCNGSWRKQS
jgi:hypothetical protein